MRGSLDRKTKRLYDDPNREQRSRNPRIVLCSKLKEKPWKLPRTLELHSGQPAKSGAKFLLQPIITVHGVSLALPGLSQDTAIDVSRGVSIQPDNSSGSEYSAYHAYPARLTMVCVQLIFQNWSFIHPCVQLR